MASNTTTATGYSTTTTNQTSNNPSGTETDATELLDDEEEGEGGVITGVSRPTKRIVLSSRTGYLVAFVIVPILSLAAILCTSYFYLDEYDYPPTAASESSLQNALLAMSALAVITSIGFVILKFRITNLLVGLIYMFLLVLCLIFPIKAIQFAAYSLAEDKPNTIQIHSENPSIEHKLHNFWAAYQKQHDCCGTREIDKVEDWSYFLNTTDLPATCCTKEQLEYASRLGLNKAKMSNINPNVKYKPELDPRTSYCGAGLARTRNKGLGFDKTLLFKRPYSGFFLSLTKSQIEKMHVKFNSRSTNFFYQPNSIPVDQLDIISKSIKTVGAFDAFMKNWKTFYLDSVCNTVDDLVTLNSSYDPESTSTACTTRPSDFDNDLAYPADMLLTSPVQSVGIVWNITKANQTCLTESWTMESKAGTANTSSTTPEEYCRIHVPKLKQNVTTIGRELLVRLDYLTTYIYEFSEGKQKIHEGTWILWSIPTRFDPTEIYPFKLATNYVRVSNQNNRKRADNEAKKMYYISRGIAENLVLKSVIHDKSCELLRSDNIPGIKEKLARDLNKRWRKSKPFSDWKNIDEGLGFFFLSQVQKIMWIIIGGSIMNIIFVFILGYDHYVAVHYAVRLLCCHSQFRFT